MNKETKSISRRKFLNSAVVATAGAAAIGAMAYDVPGAQAAPAFIGRRQADETVSLLDEIQDRGSLRVGMTLQFEPQMYRDRTGEPAGYDVELMKLLAADIGADGVELDIQDQDFTGLIPALLAGQVDLISVGLVGRPGGRLETMWFSTPYVPYQQVVVVPDDSPVVDVSELNSSDVTVTALIGSTAAGLAARIFPDATLLELDQQPALLEVASGRADGVIIEAYLAIPFVEENPTTRILNPETPFSLEFGAYAIPRGDLDWWMFVNGWLRYRKGQGILQALYDQIIGSTLGDIPVYSEVPSY
jgi:polar amino acid transport system substrate-binding protein